MTADGVLNTAMQCRSFLVDRRASPVATVAVAALLLGISFAAGAADLTGNATLTTDYVWRGTTQTQGDPATQAGIKIAADNGLYASVWGSTVRFAPETGASTELDFTAGWSHPLGEDWAVDVNVLRYQYPAATVDLNWVEFNGTLTYKGAVWASVGHSNKALGYDAPGTYALIGGTFPIDDAVHLEGGVAHYFLDDAVVARDGYTHGWVSAVWAFRKPFELRVTAHATDNDAKVIFGDNLAGARVEAALQANF